MKNGGRKYKGPGAGGKEQKNNEFAAKNALRYGFFTALVPLTSSTERENRQERPRSGLTK